MAAYALARIEYRPKFGTILLFVASAWRRHGGRGRRAGVDWRLASAVALAVFLLLARALGPPLQAHARQWRHPVLDDLAAHPAADRRDHPDLHDVPERPPARHPSRADPHLHGRQPADRGLADARLLRPASRSTSRRARSSTAPRASRSSSRSSCRWPGPASPRPRCSC